MNYNWAVNVHKLRRAEANSKSKTQEDIYRLYVEMGGLVKPGYEILKEVKVPVEIELTVKPEIVAEAQFEAPKEEVTIVPKKRGRPAKNAK